MAEKKIRAIKMIRDIRDQQYEETKDMMPEQQLVYFQKKSREFRNRLKTLKTQPRSTSDKQPASSR
jgi:hypothetical protein